MGYKVKLSVSKDTKTLCNLLTDRPAQLFDKPFFGYVVFLLTGREKKLIAEISKDLGEFESLSRDAFAYVIVAKECALPIDKIEWEQEAYATKHASKDELPVQHERVELAHIKLNGILAFKEKFDKSERGELIALSDGTNEVAKWFGVTPQLPCMLIFDPHPQTSPVVVPLDDATISNIIPIFRNVIGRISGPAYRQQIETIIRIGEINARLDAYRLPDEPSLDRIRASETKRLSDYTEASIQLNRGLRDGSPVGDVQKFLSVVETKVGNSSEITHGAVRRTHGLRKKLKDALQKVDICIACLGTQEEEDIKPRRVFRRNIAPLLSPQLNAKVPDLRDEWEEVRRSLVEDMDQQVLQITSHLPSPSELDWVSDKALEHKFQLEQGRLSELRSFVIRLTGEEEELRKQFELFLLPSFSTIVQEEVRRFGINSSIIQLRSQVIGWIAKPTNARRIATWAAKIVGGAVGL